MTIVLDENFEYGTDTWGKTETFALPGWKWNESATYGGMYGVSSIHSYSGLRSILFESTPVAGPDLYVTKWGSYGNDVWTDMMIYLTYEEGRYSDFTGGGIINARTTDQYLWGLSLNGDRRYTSDYNYIDILPDHHTGAFVQLSAGLPPLGQNLSGTYIPSNTWSRIIFHVNNLNVPHNFEAWLDIGNGIEKVADHTIVRGVLPDATKMTLVGGFSTKCWHFVDNIKFATTIDDINFGCPQIQINYTVS